MLKVLVAQRVVDTHEPMVYPGPGRQPGAVIQTERSRSSGCATSRGTCFLSLGPAPIRYDGQTTGWQTIVRGPVQPLSWIPGKAAGWPP